MPSITKDGASWGDRSSPSDTPATTVGNIRHNKQEPSPYFESGRNNIKTAAVLKSGHQNNKRKTNRTIGLDGNNMEIAECFSRTSSKANTSDNLSPNDNRFPRGVSPSFLAGDTAEGRQIYWFIVRECDSRIAPRSCDERRESSGSFEARGPASRNLGGRKGLVYQTKQ